MSGTGGQIADLGYTKPRVGWLTLDYLGTASGGVGTLYTIPTLNQTVYFTAASLYVVTAPLTCSTYPVIALWDSIGGVAIAQVALTSGTNNYTMTVVTNTGYAGHTLGIRIVTQGVGCGTFPANVQIAAQYY
jgi:hypothetical protein